MCSSVSTGDSTPGISGRLKGLVQMLFTSAIPTNAGGQSPTVIAAPVLSLLVCPLPAAEQVGALCWRLHKRRTQVLLVTSRDTGRWVLPKGWPIPGLTPEAASAQEAWEEAGVLGKVAALSIGHYFYDKIRPGAEALRCCVDVFALRVHSLKSTFPERKERRRKWFGADDAAGLVAEAELGDLLRRLHADPALLAPTVRTKRQKSEV